MSVIASDAAAKVTTEYIDATKILDSLSKKSELSDVSTSFSGTEVTSISMLLKSELQNYTQFSYIIAATEDGKIVSSSEENSPLIGQSISEIPNFQDVRNGKVIQSSAVLDIIKKDNNIGFWTMTPVYSAWDDKNAIGIIAAFYNIEHLRKLIEQISIDGHPQDKNRYIEPADLTFKPFLSKRPYLTNESKDVIHLLDPEVEKVLESEENILIGILQDFIASDDNKVAGYAKNLEKGFIAFCLVDKDIVFRQITSLRNFLIIFLALLSLVNFICVFPISKVFTQPLYTILGYVKIVSSGDLNIEIKDESNDEFGELSRAFNKMTHDLKAAMESVRSKARFEAELEATLAVQHALLKDIPFIPGLEIAAYYQAASQVGGDWYGFYADEAHNRIFFLVGDVTGHGIPSALITGVVCGAVYSGEKRASMLAGNTKYDAAKRLRDMATVLNDVILQTGRGDKMMTMVFLSLDLATGEMCYLNAGHNAGFWCQSEENAVRGLLIPGNRLGYCEEPTFGVKSFKLNPGDKVLLYTDGLIENKGPSGALIPEKKLRRMMQETGTATELKEKIVALTESEWQGQELADDVTVFCFKWDPVPELKQVYSV